MNVVVPNNEVGAAEFFDELGRFVFLIDRVFFCSRRIGNCDRDAHFACVVPAAYFCGRAACFEIKIDDVHGGILCRKSLLTQVETVSCLPSWRDENKEGA